MEINSGQAYGTPGALGEAKVLPLRNGSGKEEGGEEELWRCRR